MGADVIAELEKLAESYRQEVARLKRKAAELRHDADRKISEADAWEMAAIDAENRAAQLKRLIPQEAPNHAE